MIVGHDLTVHGDDALRAALRISAAEGHLSIGVVHVVTQQALDRTGALSPDDKKTAAIESLFPVMWRRIAAVRDEIGDASNEGSDDAHDASETELDVLVRIAPVHLARAEEHIALELLRVAVDFGATRILLGKRGRPDSVAERVERSGIIEPFSDSVSGSTLCVRVDPRTLDVAATSGYRSDKT